MSKKRGIILGVAAFAVTMALMLTVGYAIQMEYKLYGVAMTEIMFVLIAAVFAYLNKMSFKETFRFRKVSGGQFAGSLAVYAGTYFLVLAVSYMQMYLFPEMLKTSAAMSELARSEPFIITMIIMAVMPGICEEILHRGFILSSFKVIQKDWVIVLIMGLIFGLFHMDLYRFLPTAILGGGLTFIALKTGSLWVPVFFHFANNAFSVAASYAAGSVDTSAVASLTFEMAVGFALAFSGIAFILVFAGWKKLNKHLEVDSPKMQGWLAGLIALALAVGGISFAMMSEMKNIPPI